MAKWGRYERIGGINAPIEEKSPQRNEISDTFVRQRSSISEGYNSRADSVRVNVFLLGKEKGGRVIMVDGSIKGFYEACSQKFQRPIQRVWNSQGIQIDHATEFLENETVYVGKLNDTWTEPTNIWKYLFGSWGGGSEEKNKGGEGKSRQRGVSQGENEKNGENTRFWLDPDFDITRAHLTKIFQEFDEKGEGKISFKDLRDGLKRLEVEVTDAEFKRLCFQVDVDSSGDITKDEFVSSMQRLALKSRLHTKTKDESSKLLSFFCIDYGPTATLTRSHPKISIEELLQEPPGPARDINEARRDLYNVRWINIGGHHAPTLYSLADVYGLTSLEIEDALEFHERTRITRHRDGHLQIVLRVLSAKKRPPFRIKDEQLSIFLIKNTVITVTDKIHNLVTMMLPKRVNSHASKIRLFGSAYLVYRILDRVTDHAYHLLERFSKDTAVLEDKILAPKATSQATVGSVHRIIRDLRHIREWSRPVQSILNTFIEMGEMTASRPLIPIPVDVKRVESPEHTVHEDSESDRVRGRSPPVRSRRKTTIWRKRSPFPEQMRMKAGSNIPDEIGIEFYDLQLNLQDIFDHTIHMVERAEYLTSWLKSLKDAFNNEKDVRMNQVMYTLTIVTTIFVPAQFVTGVYGMNFDEMPELHWQYGYLFFWVLACSLGLILIAIFRCKGWM
ncbi:hypothetical protein AAMO2058_000538000 [Amorphochlora amoebiformis]